jgi:hypothetical protein
MPMKKLLLFLYFLVLPYLSFSTDSLKVSQANQSLFNNDTYGKIISAIIGALIAFLANYLSTRRKEKKEKKVLSYEITFNEAISRNESPIKEHISLTYRNNNIQNLTFISCVIKNTGQLVVKDEELRFEFAGSNDTQILEYYLDPKPEPELGVVEITTRSKNKDLECKYKIGHLVKNQEVKFNFIVSGSSPEIKIHDFNPSGDVIFNERGINRKLDQQEQVRKFVHVNIFLACLYPLANNILLNKSIPIDAGPRVFFIFFRYDFLWAMAFFAYNFLNAREISSIISEYFSRTDRKMQESIESSGGINNIIISAKDAAMVNITDSKSKDSEKA